MPPLLDVLDSTQIPVFSYVSSLLITSPQCFHFVASFGQRRMCLSSTTLLMRKQKAANILKTLMFLVGSPERRSRRSSRFPSATHRSASLLWPPAPNLMLHYTVEEWQRSQCVSAENAAWRKMKSTWCFLLGDPTPFFLFLFICFC